MKNIDKETALLVGYSGIFGIVIYHLFSIPAGLAVIITSTELFLLSVALKRAQLV